MSNKYDVISLEKLGTDFKRILEEITRQNKPWYKSGVLKKTVVLLMICSEATALVATIIAFNNALSPLFTAPITIVYCIAFVLLGFFQAKTIGGYLSGDDTISEKWAKVGIVINATLVCLPIAAVGILRWATRELGHKLTEEAIATTATFEENAFGIIMILLPLLIYLCEVFLVTAEVLYDRREHELVVSNVQYNELLKIRNGMQTLFDGMPSEEERHSELLCNDDEQYAAAIGIIKTLGKETIVEAVYELMKAKNMEADDVSTMTASLYKEVTGNDYYVDEKSTYHYDHDGHFDHGDDHERLRIG